VRIEFDAAKSERNARQRGLRFDRAHDFDWAGAVYDRDSCRDYPEERFVALAIWESAALDLLHAGQRWRSDHQFSQGQPT